MRHDILRMARALFEHAIDALKRGRHHGQTVRPMLGLVVGVDGLKVVFDVYEAP